MAGIADVVGIAAAVAKAVPGTAGAAAAAAQAAAEAAADHCDDVLESIPEDYSTLSGDVGDLKSALDNGKVVTSDFIQGSRNQSLVVAPTNTARCTTRNVYNLDVGDTILVTDISSGIKAAIAAAVNGSYTHDSGWQTSNYMYTVESGHTGAYFVNVAKTDGTSSISPSDISINVSIIKKTLITDIRTRLYVAELSQLGTNYRTGFYAESGDTITIMSADGSAMTVGQMYFFDEFGNQLTWCGVSGYGKSRTITLSNLARPVTSVYMLSGTAQGIVLLNDTKLSRITDAVSEDAPNGLQKIPVSFEDGGISTSDGTNTNNSDFIRSTFIDVSDVAYLRVVTDTTITNRLYNLCYYDASKTFISSLDPGSNMSHQMPETFPVSCAFVRIAVYFASDASVTAANAWLSAYKVINKDLFDDYMLNNIYGAAITQTENDFKAKAYANRIGYIWISDMHINTQNPGRITDAQYRQLQAVAKLANETDVDFVVIGGDINDGETTVSGMVSSISKYLANIGKCKKPIIYLLGNHDDNSYKIAVTKDYCKGFYTENSEFYNQIVFPNANANYYYFDIPKKYARFVCLDTIDYQQESAYNGTSWWSLSEDQVKWFCTTAVNTSNDIIVLSHMPPDKRYNGEGLGDEGDYHSDLMQAIASYNARGSIELYGETYDFASATGHIILYHVGHMHIEPKGDITFGGVAGVFTGCAKIADQDIKSYETAVSGQSNTYHVSDANLSASPFNSNIYNYYHWADRKTETINECLFDVVSVNREAGKTYTFRVGAGVDREFNL